MEGLDFGNILDDDQMSLFDEQEEETPPATEDKTDPDEGGEGKKNTTTAEVDPDNMFGDAPESVGGEGNKTEEEPDSASTGASPDFFSSIANALAEEGIFPDLDEETTKGIKDAAGLRKAIDDQIKAGLTEQQKRVAEALDNDVDPSQIKQYEGVLSYLDSIDEATLTAEGDEGDTLRKRIIYQDYINKGFSQERAEREVKRAFDNGTDVEDAKEALESNKTHFKDAYQKILDDAKADKEKEENENKAKAARIKSSILDGDIKFFGGVEIDKATRQRAFDAISKPVYKDPKTGQTYTAVQKMELDNSEEFFAKLGLIYALTDGLKSIDGLVKKKVNKEVKRGLSALESKINGTRRDSRGNLKFASGVDDTESILGKGMKLDI